MSEALVNPRLLTWARERAGLPVEIVAKRTGTTPAKVEEWEEGASRPSFRQASLWADATHVPFGYLFLQNPPEGAPSIPDLRTLPESASQAESADFIDALTSVQFKMDWYRDYRVSRGAEKLPFVGRFLARPQPAPEVVAKDMRQVLRLKADDRRTARNWEEYLRLLVTRAEDAGIWVMRSGVVGNNTHRPLSVDVFRGFAISDPVVPLVFINVRDARAAQIFTLAHELAHLWIGETGISDPFAENVAPAGSGGVESLCNATAAELLVPRVEFEREWRQREELGENTSRLSTHFKVSRIVIAIRAKVLKLVTTADFQEFLASERAKWAKEREDREGAGDYYRTARARNETDFVRAVLGRAASGELLLRDAGRLLDMTPKSVREAHHFEQLQPRMSLNTGGLC